MTSEELELKLEKWGKTWTRFHHGTCHGLIAKSDKELVLLVIANREKGNGHFQLTMELLENVAQLGGVKMVVAEVWNLRLAKNLRKHGYKWKPLFNWEKSFTNETTC